MTLIVLTGLALALGALGNRCWGWEHGSRAVGVFLITSGVVLINPTLAMYAPVMAALVWLFRVKGTGETWLAFQAGRNRMEAIARGAFILPLGAFFTYMTGSPVNFALALCFPVIAFFYYAFGKTKLADPTKYAELAAGAYVVLITV